MTRIREEEV